MPPRFEKDNISTFLTVVKSWIEAAKLIPRNYRFAYVSDCFMTLPIPVWGGKTDRSLIEFKAKLEKRGLAIDLQQNRAVEDIWDSIPLDQITPFLIDLEELLQQGIVENHVCLEKTPFLTIYTAYAIADKLARRCEAETHLSGYSSPFLPYPFTFVPDGFTSLPLKEENERYTAIQRYFSGKELLSDYGPIKKMIFPIAPELNVTQCVEELLGKESKKENLQGRYHVEYLTHLFLEP